MQTSENKPKNIKENKRIRPNTLLVNSRALKAKLVMEMYLIRNNDFMMKNKMVRKEKTKGKARARILQFSIDMANCENYTDIKKTSYI